MISKYFFISDKGSGKSDLILNIILKYWIYVFIFHFPLLYFVASLSGHDRTSDVDQTILLVVMILVSAAMAIPCLAIKPWFDRVQTRVLAYLHGRTGQARSEEATGAAAQADAAGRKPLSITSSHSRFINVAKIIAAACVVIGHFSFDEFSSWDIPGAPGYSPRFAVPAFFIISGYLAMLSLDRTKDGLAVALFKRYWALAYVVVPMLVIVPVLDHIGFLTNQELYRMHFRFPEKTMGGPESFAEFSVIFLSSMLYLNEILIFKLTGLFSASGGVIAFSNDAFWFMCYLLPFTALLAVMCKVQGAKKYGALTALAVLFGLPILISAPMFFMGAVAYQIHKRY